MYRRAPEPSASPQATPHEHRYGDTVPVVYIGPDQRRVLIDERFDPVLTFGEFVNFPVREWDKPPEQFKVQECLMVRPTSAASALHELRGRSRSLSDFLHAIDDKCAVCEPPLVRRLTSHWTSSTPCKALCSEANPTGLLTRQKRALTPAELDRTVTALQSCLNGRRACEASRNN